MPDYKNMNALEAVRYAWEASGMTGKEIAKRAGISVTTMSNYLLRDGGYLPGLDKIIPLCRAMNNWILLDWLLAQREEEPDIKPAKSRAEVLAAVAMVSAKCGDVQKNIVLNEDRGIRPELAREIRSGLKEVMLECQKTRALLAELARHRSWTEVDALACLRLARPIAWLRKLLAPRKKRSDGHD